MNDFEWVFTPQLFAVGGTQLIMFVIIIVSIISVAAILVHREIKLGLEHDK